MYAALERFNVSAQRRLVSNISSGSFSEMAPMIFLLDMLNGYLVRISQKRVYLQGSRSFSRQATMAV
jgi:hypothetical protein